MLEFTRILSHIFVCFFLLRGIHTFEDLAKIEENSSDSLWFVNEQRKKERSNDECFRSTMPPFPDKKSFRAIIQTSKDYVASLNGGEVEKKEDKKEEEEVKEEIKPFRMVSLAGFFLNFAFFHSYFFFLY